MTVPSPKFAMVWEKLVMYRQQLEVSAQYNMLFPQMSEHRRDCRTFIPEEMLNKMEYTIALLL